MKKILLLAALSLLPFPAQAARAPKAPTPMPWSVGSAIAAVVNDNVITTIDLEQRLRLSIFSSGLPDNLEVRKHMFPQILRSMIDEQLQIQEAKRIDVSVSQEELDQTLARIAQDNKVPGGNIVKFIESHGISSQALKTQVMNGLLWNKVVMRELRPRVDVGDDEIDAVIDRIRADSGKEEYLVSEILLTVDNPKDEDDVRQAAENMVDQIRKGANFGAVAKQFSQGAGAAQGGDIGWIQQGQLSSELNSALAASEPGKVSAPIRTAKGFHILGVRAKRTVTLGGDPSKASIGVEQIFRAYANADKTKVLREAAHIRGAVKACSGIEGALESFPGWKAQKLGTMTLSKAPAWLAGKVRNVAVNGSSEPLDTDKGAVVLWVCERNEDSGVDRDAILHSIGTEKLELQARRLLRDLRRDAYVDVRLGKKS